MRRREILVNSVSQPCIISMAYMMLMVAPFPALLGCAGGEQENSVVSSNSATAGTTASTSLDLAVGHTEAHQAGQRPFTSLSTDATTDLTSDGTPHPLYSDGPSTPSDSSDDAMITATSTPTGATVRLNWQHSSDAGAVGYIVYYGKQPAQESGLCTDYEANLAVDAPPATIAGLENNTIYYFAVKNYNDSEDACSEEIMVPTPPART